MRWIKTDNPRVWEALDECHFVQVQPIGLHYHRAQIYARSRQLGLFEEPSPTPVPQMWAYSQDQERALCLAIKHFDKEAELPADVCEVWP